MFQFPPLASHAYVFSMRWRAMTPAGFPHSDIHGSTLESSSPWLFAGFHVLHRLLVPRHPPCALCSLTSLAARRPQDLSVVVNHRQLGRVRGSFRHPRTLLALCSCLSVNYTCCSRLTLTSCVLVKSETHYRASSRRSRRKLCYSVRLPISRLHALSAVLWA
jgi:hypothetical protein